MFLIAACKSKVFFWIDQENTLLFKFIGVPFLLLFVLQVDYKAAALAGGEYTSDNQHLIF